MHFVVVAPTSAATATNDSFAVVAPSGGDQSTGSIRYFLYLSNPMPLTLVSFTPPSVVSVSVVLYSVSLYSVVISVWVDRILCGSRRQHNGETEQQ